MHRSACLAVLLGTLAALPARAHSANPGSGDPAPSSVRIPRVPAEILVDGVLDEDVWRQAAFLTGFSVYVPVDGRPAVDSTHVYAWYGPTAIHFGIRAFETHGEVRATLADRDKIANDDYVLILLDPFDAQREAVVIGVNPLGAQADGILKDAPRATGGFGGGGSTGVAYAIDYNPDYVYQSKGRLTDFGFEVEVTVPFKSLRYQSSTTQDWGFNVLRKEQHSGWQSTWTPVSQANNSFLAQGGRLEGLTDLRRGIVLDLNPELTSSVPGRPGAAPGEGWTYSGGSPEFGGNVRWGVTNNLVLNATVNPDFSQVEADVAQIQYDPRNAVFVPEKRPFFLDGSENFSTPGQLIYTRRIANPVGAAKLSGKIGNHTVGLLSAVDCAGLQCGFSDLGDASLRTFNVLRVRRDLSGQNTLGLTYTDLDAGSTWNRVASLDGRLVFGKIYSLEWQAAGSFTNDGGDTYSAPLWDLDFSASGREYGIRALVSGIHGKFRARSGFITRAGIVHALIQPRRTFYGEEGARFESITLSMNLDGTWDYDRFTRGTEPNDAKWHLNFNSNLRGGWQVGGQLLYESFKYPPELYEDYWVELHENGVPVDTVRYVGTDRFTNKDIDFSITTPRWKTFSGNVFLIYGRDENFFEWAPADIFMTNLTANWQPTDQVRVAFTYQHQQYIRFDDKSNVGLRRVPRLKLEYQATRALFLRLVAQYDANFVDALRDNSRTDDPILIRDPETGTFHRTSAMRSNRLRFDWLLSYRPTPGTVLFLGYGSTVREQDSFRFRSFDRLDDGFFLKLSYLFRV